jgi:anti-anti-sigma factor
MKVRFWGTRGSIPSPLKPEEVEEKICQAISLLPDIDVQDMEAVRAYVRELPPLLRGTAGGNTPCVEIQAGSETFIIDAGSGLRELGLELMKGPCGQGEGTLHLFISHPHWDHIQGFPFFNPALVPGNRILIYSLHDLKTALEEQQRPLNFSIPAKLEFIHLQMGQPVSIGPVRVNTILNPHPGDSCSFRFERQHCVLVYASDAEYKELDAASLQPYLDFFKDADALIFDAQYTLKEAWQKIDWGHSSAMIGADMARAAGVKRLLLFHHDPTYSDTQLEEIRSRVLAYQTQDDTYPTCEVMVAYEGLTLDLTLPGTAAIHMLPDNKAAVLTPISVFDERGVDQLARQLARLARRGASANSIIDLSQVETLTTASLKSLVALRQARKRALIVLAAPSDNVRQVIHLAGYTDYFAIYPSVEAALAAVQAREALNLGGQMIQDRYQIESKISESGLGAVLKASDTHTLRTVALKVLSPCFSQETLDRFMDQAQPIINLDHRNIVRVFTWDKDEQDVFIVEEFVNGPTLQHRLEDDARPLTPDQIMSLVRDITHALEYAHSLGVIHTDLKPYNVFLTAEGAKLNGFGLGRLEEGRNLLTAPLLFLTAWHLAPEQILGQTLDARTDLYALGVMLYQLLTGCLPFEGSDRHVLQAHLSQSPRPPRELNPRLSLFLEHLILKLLAKNPNDRYDSAQQVWRIWSSLMVGAEDETRRRRRTLVGRERQLQALQACWAEARAGRGQLAFIAGEPGIGKTCLALQAASQSNPPVLLIGRCQEQPGGQAYHAFAQVLRSYFAAVALDSLDDPSRQLIGNFAQLIPEIRQMLPGLPVPPPLEPKQEQLRGMVSLTQFVKRATQERPWFLILDDLHWADPSSLELLHHLGRSLPSMALLVIGTYRDVELEHSHPLLEVLSDLSRHPTYLHLPLDRLDQGSVGRVLADIWEQPVSEALTGKIHEDTGGNPLYVEQVAKGLVDDGLITLQEGQWHFPTLEEVRLPPNVRDAVWRRIRRLDPDTQTLLRQASVLGLAFRFDDLQEVSGLSQWEALEHLDMALERELVQEAPSDAMLRFSHSEIQSVLYVDMGRWRRLPHRQAGEVLERRAEAAPESVVGELAYHFTEAEELEKALDYSSQAARQAAAIRANPVARLWYNRTLDIFGRLGPTKAIEFQSLWLSVHESLGAVLALMGEYDEALSNYASARVLLEVESPSADQARRLVKLYLQTADVHEQRGEYDRALEWLEKGVGYLDENEPTIEMAQIYFFEADMYRHQSRYDEAVDQCQKSLDIASKINTPEGRHVIGRAYCLLGDIYRRRGDLGQAERFCGESVRVYQEIDDIAGQSNAYNNLGDVYYDLKDWGQAGEAYHKSLTMRQEIGDICGQGISVRNLGRVHFNRGEWAEAASFFEQSRFIWEQIGEPLREAITLGELAQVHLCQGSWTEAQICLSRSQSLLNETDRETYPPEVEAAESQFSLARLALEIRSTDKARTHLAQAVKILETLGELAFRPEAREIM